MNIGSLSQASLASAPVDSSALLPNIGSLKEMLGAVEKSEAAMTKVAEDFESVFLSLILKEMRNTLDETHGGLFGGENSDTYGGMFDMFMGQSLAESRQLGIADAVEKFMAQQKAGLEQLDLPAVAGSTTGSTTIGSRDP